MESSAVINAHHVLVTFAIIFAVGAVCSKMADFLKVPDVVIYLGAGILLGPFILNIIAIHPDSVVNQLVLILGASVLLFHGGIGVQLHIIKKVWSTIMLMATLSVVIMIIIVGYSAHLILGLDLLPSFLLAAILAPTDPAILVPIFLATKIKQRLAQTVLCEAAFNDVTGSIITFTLLGILITGEYSVSASIMSFFRMAGGGVIIGAFYGFVAGYLISNKVKNILSEYAQVLILPVIIASYMTAEFFGASGFMAVFVAGVVFGNLDTLGWVMPDDCQEEVHSFIHITSLLLRIAIFIILGANLNFTLLLQYLLPGLAVVFIFMFVARPIAVLAATLPDRRAKWHRNEMLFMFWTRETGVIPAALIGLINSMGIEFAGVIASVIFIAILVTVGVQATTTKMVAVKLGLVDTGEENLEETLFR